MSDMTLLQFIAVFLFGVLVLMPVFMVIIALGLWLTERDMDDSLRYWRGLSEEWDRRKKRKRGNK